MSQPAKDLVCFEWFRNTIISKPCVVVWFTTGIILNGTCMKNVHVKQVYTKTDKLYSFLRMRKYTFFTNFFPGLKKKKSTHVRFIIEKCKLCEMAASGKWKQCIAIKIELEVSLPTCVYWCWKWLLFVQGQLSVPAQHWVCKLLEHPVTVQSTTKKKRKVYIS